MVRPVRRVFLHVGTPKSGTTYLQELLWRNQDSLRANGVLYPGDRPDAHFLATLDLLGRRFHGQVDPAVQGAWERLAAEVRAWRHTAVISHEMLAPAEPDAVRRAVRSFGDAEVHIVCTARDLARQVPAVWQEDVKNRGKLTFDEFSRSLRGLDDSVDPYFAKTFWGYQDLTAVLRTWGADLPPERVHVVPIPRGVAGNALLLRFAETVGLDPVRCPIAVSPRNPSTGVVETNLLRRLNTTGVLDDLEWRSYESLTKEFLALDVLAERPGAVPLRLPPGDRAWVREWSAQTVESLRAAGYHVVGDLADLLPESDSTADAATVHPDEATDGELLDAALYAVAATLQRLGEERRKRVAAPHAKRLALRGLLVERYRNDPRMRWLLRHYRRARARIRDLRNRSGTGKN
jgi:hypothetical protein